MPIIATRASAAYGAGFGGRAVAPSNVYGGYEALSTIKLTSNTSTVSFDGIPGGFRSIQVKFIAQNNRNSTWNGFLQLRINGNYTTKYHTLTGNGTSVDALSGTPSNTTGYSLLASGTVSNTYGVGIVDIANYDSEKQYKTINVFSGNDCNGSGAVGYASQIYTSINPIHTITFEALDGYSITTNSQFALYGVR